jgi:broad specificity phosphatase PhoE
MRRRAACGIMAVVHSGLRRASYLAELIAEEAGIEPRVDDRWRERDFGSWEERTWNSIWRETGNAMDRMLSDPGQFRPGGGETTAELFERSVGAWRALPAVSFVVVVTHAGPIACVRCRLEKSNLARLPKFRIAEAAAIEVKRRDCSNNQ